MIIWLASYPRSGNTFIRIILNHAFGIKTYSIYGDKYDIAADDATREIVGHKELPENFDYHKARQSDELYFIKTHEPYSKDYENDKAIYVLRDGREATVSYYYYLDNFSKNKHNYLEIINGYTYVCSWGEHLLSWQHANQEKILKLRFEKIILSAEAAISQISAFVGLTPLKFEVPSFEILNKTNPSFFRSGKKDSFVSELSEYEQKYFWLVNGQAMHESGYIDKIPEYGSQIERDQLLFDHILLTNKRGSHDFGVKIDQLKNQLQQKNEEHRQNIQQLLKNKDAVIQQKDEQLKNKDALIQQKDQQIQGKERQLKDKDTVILQRDRLVENKDVVIRQKDQQIQEKDQQLTHKDAVIQQLNQQIQGIINSYSLRVGKILIFPLSVIKKFFLKLKK